MKKCGVSDETIENFQRMSQDSGPGKCKTSVKAVHY